MKPRILILTGTSLHHKYFALELSKVGEVVGIIVESPKGKPFKKKLKQFGWRWTFLKILSKLFGKYSSSSPDLLNEFYNTSETEMAFDNNLKDKVIHLKAINAPESLELIKGMNPDYICSLGGALIKDKGISLANKCALNFHSGISPFYNGADINEKVFESRNLNFIGGTLMVMTAKIDAGFILAHHFPQIETGDSPKRLFHKGIVGGTNLYKEFITYVEQGNDYEGLEQSKAMHYYLGYDHQYFTDIVTGYFLKRNMHKRYLRDAFNLTYYDSKNTLTDMLRALKLFKI